MEDGYLPGLNMYSVLPAAARPVNKGGKAGRVGGVVVVGGKAGGNKAQQASNNREKPEGQLQADKSAPLLRSEQPTNPTSSSSNNRPPAFSPVEAVDPRRPLAVLSQHQPLQQQSSPQYSDQYSPNSSLDQYSLKPQSFDTPAPTMAVGYSSRLETTSQAETRPGSPFQAPFEAQQEQLSPYSAFIRVCCSTDLLKLILDPQITHRTDTKRAGRHAAVVVFHRSPFGMPDSESLYKR